MIGHAVCDALPPLDSLASGEVKCDEISTEFGERSTKRESKGVLLDTSYVIIISKIK